MEIGCTKSQIHATFRIVKLITWLCKRAKRVRPIHRRRNKTESTPNASSHHEWRDVERRIEQATYDRKVPLKDIDGFKLGEILERLSKKVLGIGSGSDCMVLARNDKLLRRRERSFPYCSWTSLWNQTCMINEARRFIQEIKKRKDSCSADSKSFLDGIEYHWGLDEKSLANLDYLLLRLRGSLVQEYMRRVRHIASICTEIYHPARRKPLKLGGEKWCSEYANKKRPQSTTWPWNIRSALAILWGDCWMFHDPYSINPNFTGQQNWQRQQQSIPSPQVIGRRSVTNSGATFEMGGAGTCPRNSPYYIPDAPHTNMPQACHSLRPPLLINSSGNNQPSNPSHQPFFQTATFPQSSLPSAARGHVRNNSSFPDHSNFGAAGTQNALYTLPNADSSSGLLPSAYSSAFSPASFPPGNQGFIFPNSSGGGMSVQTRLIPSNNVPMSDTIAEEDLAAAALTAHNNGTDLDTSPHNDPTADEDIDNDSFEPFSPRRGHTHKRAEEPPKNDQGKMMCKFQSTCSGVTFDRKCEWSKHMDKHERPYKCEHTGCEKLQGFTYSGGLLRHQREVHKMHGGTKEPLFCPFENCKRNAGSGFTRKENLHEHIRRVHRRATDGLDLSNASKRDFDAMDSTTDPLLRGTDDPMQATEDVGDENIDPNMGEPTSNPTKRRRLPQTNGTPTNESNMETISELKATLQRVIESNRFLVQQNQNIRQELHSLTARVNKMEGQFGQSLMEE